MTFDKHGKLPLGVFRDVERPAYDDLMAQQLADAVEKRGEGDLAALVGSGDTWQIN
jgi:2-oxoglutarate ferredoxin oxidoreductase subunit beta